MVTKLPVEDFLKRAEKHPVIDVRSPGEFAQAHIPGAVSLPLFSNTERAAIGTLYKQRGREEAMKLGLEYYGPNMQHIISALKQMNSGNKLNVYCWRGGMRSGVVSWMLDLFGYQVSTLNNGYKQFRKSVLDSFLQPKNILILGGKTGSGKTEILHELNRQGEQVIDLEAMAHHKGSAFGGIGETAPPSQEQFENDLYIQFRKINSERQVWLEDESQRIGTINLPNALWEQMRNAKIHYLDIPFNERLKYLVNTYGHLDKEKLISATMRIQKRLGGLETKNVVQFLSGGKLEEAFTILLKYYDKVYVQATQRRIPETISLYSFKKFSLPDIAKALQSAHNNLNGNFVATPQTVRKILYSPK